MKTKDSNVQRLCALPNVGPATAQDLLLLGISRPEQLAGRDPARMYEDLCRLTGARQDPCVWDVFLALVDHARGAPARPWWHYTAARKALQKSYASAAGSGARAGSVTVNVVP